MLSGDLFIGDERRPTSARFHAHDPALAAEIRDVAFAGANEDDVSDACAAAEAAFLPYSTLPLETRALFLEAIADEIDALGEVLVERACRETGLPPARITGERGRTSNQLRLFAAEVRDGAWQRLRIDHADPARSPPKPDLRLRMIPLGPVAVFGASNFPLAFSVAGGDTASALAAGCPVVVKAHRAHPGTAELIGQAIGRAVASSGVPAGVFNLVHGITRRVGEALVANPIIQAVGFTGSREGGEALMRIASQRPRPIPVYAEMSAINPVVLLPGALASRGEALADGFVTSLSMGAGQFCTNPGLVLAMAGADLDAFEARAVERLTGQQAQVMLTPGICEAFEKGKTRLAASSHVVRLGEGTAATGPGQGRAALFRVDGKDFLSNPIHMHEVFGASSLVVRCADTAELSMVLNGLEGQLTAALHFGDEDLEAVRALIPVLERTAGRIIANGWPTGVEVTHAMVHGGPYPATSDPRSTSVGTLAIDRFLRPVSYQDMPTELLPTALQDDGRSRPVRIDGNWTI